MLLALVRREKARKEEDVKKMKGKKFQDFHHRISWREEPRFAPSQYFSLWSSVNHQENDETNANDGEKAVSSAVDSKLGVGG